MPLNISIQWNAGTAWVSECVLKTLASRGLRVGPSKFGWLQGEKALQNLQAASLSVALRAGSGMADQSPQKIHKSEKRRGEAKSRTLLQSGSKTCHSTRNS